MACACGLSLAKEFLSLKTSRWQVPLGTSVPLVPCAPLHSTARCPDDHDSGTALKGLQGHTPLLQHARRLSGPMFPCFSTALLLFQPET